MLFLHPMWHHESERIGKQKCTSRGYALHVIAELIGFIGLGLLVAVPVLWVREGITGSFRAVHLWLLTLPLALGLLSEALFQFSWWLALRKGFRYDPEQCEASWIEAGERRTYNYPA